MEAFLEAVRHTARSASGPGGDITTPKHPARYFWSLSRIRRPVARVPAAHKLGGPVHRRPGVEVLRDAGRLAHLVHLAGHRLPARLHQLAPYGADGSKVDIQIRSRIEIRDRR